MSAIRLRFRSTEIYTTEQDSWLCLAALTGGGRFYVGDCEDCEEHTIVARCPHGSVRCGPCTHHSLCSDESDTDWPEIVPSASAGFVS